MPPTLEQLMTFLGNYADRHLYLMNASEKQREDYQLALNGVDADPMMQKHLDKNYERHEAAHLAYKDAHDALERLQYYNRNGGYR